MKNNSVEREGREEELQTLFCLPDWGSGGKIEKERKSLGKRGEEEKEGSKEKRKGGGERGDKRFIKVKQLWTTAKVVSTNLVCLFLDLTDWCVSQIAESLPSEETNKRVSFFLM